MTYDQPHGILLIGGGPDRAADALAAHFGASAVERRDRWDQLNFDEADRYAVLVLELEADASTAAIRVCRLRRAAPRLTVLLLTPPDRLGDALWLISQGADGYLLTAPGFERALGVEIERHLKTAELERRSLRDEQRMRRAVSRLKQSRRELHETRQRWEQDALCDPLTGVGNRRAYEHHLSRMFAEACRYEQDLSLLMLDMDRFKAVNDRWGHGAGDELLQLAGQVLGSCCRDCDVVCRYGGDEFVVLLPHTGADGAQALARRALRQFAGAAKRQFIGRGRTDPPAVSLSVGAASLRRSRPINPGVLAEQADAALQQAKRSRRGRVIVHAPQPQRPDVRILPQPLKLAQ